MMPSHATSTSRSATSTWPTKSSRNSGPSCLAGKLAGADKSKGRFRDYLRTVLHRLIIDHFRTRKLQPLPPGDLLDPSRPDEDFDRVWREAVINRVWSRLETYQATTPKNRYATVLQLRRDFPKASIDEIAEKLGEITRTQVTPEAFRKNLQRARAKFIELLVQELRETIHPTSNEAIEAEIFDLGLGHLYRRYSTAARRLIDPSTAARSSGPSPRISVRPSPAPICIRIPSASSFPPTDENSPIPLTRSFQHVQFIEGGVRNAESEAGMRPSFAGTYFAHSNGRSAPNAMSTREERQCWFSPARKTRASSSTIISR